MLRFSPSLGFNTVCYPPPGCAMIGDGATAGTFLKALLGTTDVAYIGFEKDGRNATIQLSFSLPSNWQPPLTIKFVVLNLGAPAGTAQLKVWATCPEKIVQDGSGQGAGNVIPIPLAEAVPPRMPGLYVVTKEFNLDTSFCRQRDQFVVLRIKREKNNPDDTLQGSLGIPEIQVNWS